MLFSRQLAGWLAALLLTAAPVQQPHNATPAQRNGSRSPAATPVGPQAPPNTMGPVSRIHAPSATYHFPNDQVFYYTAEWRLWNAGTATLALQEVAGQEKISATADAIGVVALLYTVKDRFESRVDPKTFCSIRIDKSVQEGFRSRDTHIRFDSTRGKSVLDETNLKTRQSKHQENEIPSCVTDVLSGIFYVGSLPLQAGTTYTFPLNDGGKTVDVTARVEAREQVKTEAGTYQTIRVQPEASSGVLKDRGRVWIWYSDDAAHIPVQMRARMFWGTLTFRLQRIERKK